MRGPDHPQTTMFSYVSIEDRIPADHPLRAIQALVNPMLAELSPRFQAMYARLGRPSIPPERLLRALLLQTLYTIRSERQLMEQLDYNLLFRWFVGLNPDDAVWVPTVFTKNRDRLIEGHIADAFLHEILKAADTRGLLSHEHFTVDGTLLEAWASHKSVRPTDDPAPPPSDNDPKNPTVNFRQETRSNATHQSVTDPDCRLARKSQGTGALLCHLGSVLMDNRHGLIVATDVRSPSGTAEREAGVEMLTTLEPRARRRTLGADKGYDALDFVADVRACHTSPHVSPNIHAHRPRSAIDGRTTRHKGFALSQVKRKLVEEGFAWSKTIGGVRKLHHRGREKISWVFTFTNAAYNLVRMRTLIRAGVCA
ncbi:MAG: IS5 family transposase [Gemmatimonadaceae bacterium]